MQHTEEKLINVIQGDFAISESEGEILTTILGSCVALCLSDPMRKIGGMNHFLLPGNDKNKSMDVRYGIYAMELLINGMLRKGAHKDCMQAKLFGGANMLNSLSDIGESNSIFARKFLKDEGIPCLNESLGGTSARRIRYWPTTGQAKQLVVPGDINSVAPVKAVPSKPKPSEDIVLF